MIHNAARRFAALMAVFGAAALTGCQPKAVEIKTTDAAGAAHTAGDLTRAADAAGTEGFPGTEEGAKALLAEFVKPGADHAKLTAALRPTQEDLNAVFQPDLAKKAAEVYGPVWESGEAVVAPKPGQTEVQVSSATAEELKTGGGGAADFPGGYKDVADKIKPGVRLYRFEFVEPGKTDGMAFDGLYHANGAWHIAPKPFRLL